MHEVGIMESVLNMAQERAIQGGAKRITRIVITVGSLSGVVPESLDFAFRSLSPGSMAHGAHLEIVSIDALSRCESCQKDFPFTGNGCICPHCEEPSMTFLRGRELELSTIEWI